MKRKPRRLLVNLKYFKKGSSRERERKHENRKDMKNYRENNYRCCCQFIFNFLLFKDREQDVFLFLFYSTNIQHFDIHLQGYITQFLTFICLITISEIRRFIC